MSLSSRKSRTLAPRVDRLEERLALSTIVAGLATDSRKVHAAWASHRQSRALVRTPMRSQGVARGDGAALAHPGGFSNSVVMARLAASDATGPRLRQQAIHTHAPAATGVFTASAGSHPVRLAMRSSAADTAQAAPSRHAGSSRAPASTPGAIRPLALAPGPKRSAGRDSTPDLTTLSGSGGTTPPVYYPTLHGSGGSVGSVLADGEDPAKPKNWVLNNPAPVGDIMHFWVENIDTSKILSYTWSGGSDVKSYFSGDGEDPSILHNVVSMTPGVPKDQEDYDFIIPATVAPQNYDVKLTIKYILEATGTAPDSVLHCTFTTVSPDTATLAVEQQGAPQADNPLATIAAGLWLNYPGIDAADAGIKITASTKAASSVGGKFMFLQLSKPDRTTTTYNPTTGLQDPPKIIESRDERFYPARWGDGWNIDDGDGYTGYPLAGYPSSSPVFQWNVSAGQTSPPISMSDSPQSRLPESKAVGITIGRRNPNGTYSPEHYVTYLMYQPPSGVWVALYKVEWSFGISISVTHPTKTAVTVTTVSVTNLVVNPSSAVGEWPSWIGRVSEAKKGHN